MNNILVLAICFLSNIGFSQELLPTVHRINIQKISEVVNYRFDAVVEQDCLCHSSHDNNSLFKNEKKYLIVVIGYLYEKSAVHFYIEKVLVDNFKVIYDLEKNEFGTAILFSLSNEPNQRKIEIHMPKAK